MERQAPELISIFYSRFLFLGHFNGAALISYNPTLHQVWRACRHGNPSLKVSPDNDALSLLFLALDVPRKKSDFPPSPSDYLSSLR